MSEQLDLGALRALEIERADCARRIADSKATSSGSTTCDASTRTHDRKWAIEEQMLAAFPALLAAAGERDQWPEAIASALCTKVKGDRTVETWANHVRLEHEAHTMTGNRLIAVANERDQLRAQNAALQAEVERLRALHRAVANLFDHDGNPPMPNTSRAVALYTDIASALAALAAKEPRDAR